MVLRALTLHQPWASLIANGEKVYETRSWEPPEGLTHVAIHAGKTVNDEVLKEPVFRHALGFWNPEEQIILPSSAILCVCRIVKAFKVYGKVPEDRRHESHREKFFGNFDAGRFAWKLERVFTCTPPIQCRGAQRIWRMPPTIERFLLQELNSR